MKTSSTSAKRSPVRKQTAPTGAPIHFPKRRRVVFTLKASPNSAAAVAGSFSQWQPISLSLTPQKGSFTKTFYLPPGDYEYRFVVDGQWQNDPSCEELVPNPFGTANSVLHVT